MLDSASDRPAWWTPHEVPRRSSTRSAEFLRSGLDGVSAGGIVGLDGVHPTKQRQHHRARVHQVVKRIGVRFHTSTGEERKEPQVDVARRIRGHAALTPLNSGLSTLDLLGRLDERFARMAGFERALRRRTWLRRAQPSSRPAVHRPRPA